MGQASAKIGKLDLQAREMYEIENSIVGGVGHALGHIKSTIAVAMKEVESTVPAMSLRATQAGSCDRDQGGLAEGQRIGIDHRGRQWCEWKCVSAEQNIDEGITYQRKTRLQDFRSRATAVARVEVRCCGLCGHTPGRNSLK